MRRLIIIVSLVLSGLGAGVAFPTTAAAQGNEPIPPPNDMACNGLIVAYGDHPAASPAFVARELGMSVSQALIFFRDISQCALQK